MREEPTLTRGEPAGQPDERQPLLRLFRKGSAADELIDSLKKPEETKERKSPRIRCPLCMWQPGRSSLWYCVDTGHPEYFFDACGTGWNTFDTRGRCPGCLHQWRWTSCLACAGWSLHEDWYEKDDA